MMKENCKTNPYASFDFTVKCEKKQKDCPKSTVRCGTDLRAGGNKK